MPGRTLLVLRRDDAKAISYQSRSMAIGMLMGILAGEAGRHLEIGAAWKADGMVPGNSVMDYPAGAAAAPGFLFTVTPIIHAWRWTEVLATDRGPSGWPRLP
jgi:hypothetical protein